MNDLNNRPGGPNLIVTAKTAHKVHFLDAATLTMQATIDMPGSTHELALSTDGRTAYGSVYGDGVFAKRVNPDRRIVVIDLPSKSLKRVIDLGAVYAPHGVMMDEQGTQDWESQVRDFAVSFRSITRQHPHLMPLLTVRSPDDPLLLGIHDRMIEVWRRAGLSAEDAQSAQRALQSYLSGSSQWHQESCQGEAAETDFRYGLDVFLDGVRSRVAEAAAAS